MYECSQSDDADYFLDYDPAKYRALLFYTPSDESSADFEKVQSIFMDTTEPTWSGELWISQNSLDINAMRVNIENSDNQAIVTAFEATKTPKIVLFDDLRDAVEEVISPTTYDSIKKVIDGSSSSTSTPTNSDGSVTLGGTSPVVTAEPTPAPIKPVVEQVVKPTASKNSTASQPPVTPKPTFIESVPKSEFKALAAKSEECKMAAEEAQAAAKEASDALETANTKYKKELEEIGKLLISRIFHKPNF